MDFPDTVLNPNPVKKANALSRHLFLWMIPLFRKGYKKDLKLKDFYTPRRSDLSAELGDNLERAWNVELEKVAMGKSKKPSLAKALWSVYGRYYSALFILYIITDCILRVGQTLLVRYLVQSFSSTSDFTTRDRYLLAAGVILATFLVTMCFHPSFHGGFIIAMRCRVACSSIVYRKTLRLKSSETSVGQLVNLLSNDVNRFDLNLLFFPFLIIAPMQLAIFVYFLYNEFGVSCLPGIALVLIMAIMQYWNGKLSTKYRRQIAERTDERGKIMGEIITGIRVIKMYVWETPFTVLIQRLRRMEMKVIRKRSYLRGLYLSTFSSASKLVPFLTFLIYVLAGNDITAEQVFFTAAVYNVIIQNMMYFVPSAVSGLGEVSIALRRIEDFLALKEIKKPNPVPSGESAKIVLNNVTASWTERTNTLSNLNLLVETSSLTCVVGPVGCGKSSLLHLLLGELEAKEGTSLVSGKLSYACQEPWIFSGSVRQNILFGLEFEEARYASVVSCAALLNDFKQLAHADETVVGDKGTSLSGGQKARVSLARALYQRADIYLLDDPLSAVDPKVSRHLFEQSIRGFLKDKIVVLVTHQLQYLSEADKVVVLENGKVVAQGKYEDVQLENIDFLQCLMPTEEKESNQETSEDTGTEAAEGAQKQAANEEATIQGTMNNSVYWKYFQTGNSYLGLAILVFASIMAQLSITATEFWMSYWTNHEEERRLNPSYEEEGNYLSEDTYMSVYGGLVAMVLGMNLFRAFVWFSYTFFISVNMHNKMFTSLVKGQTKFFDENPSGRIMNRFTKDLGQMDEMLPPMFFETTLIFLQMLGVIAVVIAANWIIAPPSVVILLLLWIMRGIFVSTARDIKRVEGTAKSPVFTHAVSSFSGLTTIRSSGSQSKLVQQFDGLQDFHTSCWFLFISSTRCFGIWVEMVSILFLAIVTFSFMVLPESSDGGSVGMSITAAMNLTTWFQFAMRQSAEVSNLMTSVERALEYVGLPSEGRDGAKAIKDKEWPPAGRIEFKKASLAYNLKQVLNDLSFEILPCEKVGVVGRTGAGKSSIIQALFRMTEPTGQILIDSLDINTLELSELRKKISIIPQEPILFCGSIRKNLDPFSEHEDVELWTALEESGLKDSVPSLDFSVAEGGSNFSVGQKQLVCLARAVLRKNKILIMDEATANVDPMTDQLIQRAIRRTFANCTVITIAHRLQSVMDCDKILVLEAGNIMEFGSPWQLLQNPQGYLTSMVETLGKGTADILKQIAETHHNIRDPENNNDTDKKTS